MSVTPEESQHASNQAKANRLARTVRDMETIGGKGSSSVEIAKRILDRHTAKTGVAPEDSL